MQSTPKAILINTALFIAAAAVLYIAASPLVAMPLYKRLIFHPHKSSNFQVPTLTGFESRECWIEKPDGTKLNAWYIRHPQAKATVLFSHGSGTDLSERVPFLEMLLRQKCSVLAYDYGGYGKSTGSYSIESVSKDGLAAFDYLTDTLKVPPKSIVLYGESLGGGVTCRVAEKRKASGIVLQSPFYSLEHVAKKTTPILRIYPRFLFPADCLDNHKTMSEPHPPVLLIHGTSDKQVPFEESQALYESAIPACKLVVVPNADHIALQGVRLPLLEKHLSIFLDSLDKQGEAKTKSMLTEQ